jgi:predicted dehydrogenase
VMTTYDPVRSAAELYRMAREAVAQGRLGYARACQVTARWQWEFAHRV